MGAAILRELDACRTGLETIRGHAYRRSNGTTRRAATARCSTTAVHYRFFDAAAHAEFLYA